MGIWVQMPWTWKLSLNQVCLPLCPRTLPFFFHLPPPPTPSLNRKPSFLLFSCLLSSPVGLPVFMRPGEGSRQETPSPLVYERPAVKRRRISSTERLTMESRQESEALLQVQARASDERRHIVNSARKRKRESAVLKKGIHLPIPIPSFIRAHSHTLRTGSRGTAYCCSPCHGAWLQKCHSRGYGRNPIIWSPCDGGQACLSADQLLAPRCFRSSSPQDHFPLYVFGQVHA